jgi:hypothetical protein
MNLGIPDTASLTIVAFYAAFVFGLVAALRKEVPKIDGRVVYVFAFVMSLGIAALVAPDVHAYRAIAWFGLQIAGAAIALASGVNYAAGKMSTTANVGTAIVQAVAGEMTPEALAGMKAGLKVSKQFRDDLAARSKERDASKDKSTPFSG